MSEHAEPNVRLTVEHAVRQAIHALPRFLGGQTASNIRVEEVFPPRADTRTWRITLSHLEPGVDKPKPPALAAIEGVLRTPPPLERVYHVLEVDASSGEVVSMRLREEPR